MNMYDIIVKKRDGRKLTKEEIQYFVEGYITDTIPDYQMSAMLMALFLSGMDKEETIDLTMAMKNSGDVIDLSRIRGIKVDKHSTGGVGDKTTLIVGPIAAACGVPVAKMSGRGLGFTGGTIDKLESIPGFKSALTADDFILQVSQVGLSVTGQTGKIAPADKKIYALRDVTGTVEHLGLITSSVMSKKLASGSDAIVLDVKCGNGAFMEDLEKAEELGELMVEIGNADQKRTVAVITDMDQPLGFAIGNSLEVMEAIETLKGNGPSDITELSVTLAGVMIFIGGKATSLEEGIEQASAALQDGKALDKFRDFVKGQGGNMEIVDHLNLLPHAGISLAVTSPAAGFVGGIKAREIGIASQKAGAGRLTKEDEIDLSAGIYLNKKVGDAVLVGETLATVCGNDQKKVEAGTAEVMKAFNIVGEKPETEPLIKKIIGLD